MPDDLGKNITARDTDGPAPAQAENAPQPGHQQGRDLEHVAAGSNAHAPHRGPRKPRHLKLFGVVVLIAALSSAAYGIIVRRQAESGLARWTDQQAIPTVAVAHPLTSAVPRKLVLPGDVEAYYEAPIYARVNGYLQAWYQDIGAHVQAGQLLATIDTPDLDQRIMQAQADLASARANAALADLTAKRWHACWPAFRVRSNRPTKRRAMHWQRAPASMRSRRMSTNCVR
jgi:hypothetical protein